MQIRIEAYPSYSFISKPGYRIAWEALSYMAEVWHQGQYRMQMREVKKSFVEKWTDKFYPGKFASGFLPRVSKALEDKGFEAEVVDHAIYPTPANLASSAVSGKTIRDYQVSLISEAIRKRRGVLVAPTGSGKTIVAIAITRYFPNIPILIVEPSIALLHQTYGEFTKVYGANNVGMIGDGFSEPGRITIGVINSVAKVSNSRFITNDIKLILIDECHRVKKGGMYEQILVDSQAPIRIGLTATPPIEQFPSLALEGLIGPIIKRVFIKHLEGTVLAKPRIKLIELPERNIMRNYARYGEVYQKGVVENNALNSRVIHMIHELTSNEHDPRTCLVIVKRIEHGKILENLMRQKLPHLAGKFLFSETDSEQREIIREGLDAKKFWVAITTSIWKEGVDIPSLGAIINAAGGKDEIPNLQWLGRGMRKPAGKTDLLIVDFFDPSHHYLISHFGKRLCLYFKMGWMG